MVLYRRTSLTSRNRVDPVVCCNVLSLFYTYGRGEELAPTLEWIILVLRRRAYINRTTIYPVPEAFLYFFHRFLQHIRNGPNYAATSTLSSVLGCRSGLERQ
jgi:hypothetical protein